MQGAGQGLESVFPVRLIFGHFEGTEGPATHQMTNVSKKGPQIVDTFRKPGRRQCSILPLKIVFRCTHKIKDLPDGPVNYGANIQIDHSTLSLLLA